MTTGASTIKLGASPIRGSKAEGRGLDEWGGRRVAIFELTSLTLSSTTGVPFDPSKFIDFVPTVVIPVFKLGTSDHNYTVLNYDAINKALFTWDFTDSDAGDGDQPAGSITVIVLGE